MISVGVDMTSYLTAIGKHKQRVGMRKWLQLENVRVLQHPHVFEIPSNFDLHPIAMYYSFGMELHGDFMTSNGVYGH
jgi:hypothetical protein